MLNVRCCWKVLYFDYSEKHLTTNRKCHMFYARVSVLKKNIFIYSVFLYSKNVKKTNDIVCFKTLNVYY